MLNERFYFIVFLYFMVMTFEKSWLSKLLARTKISRVLSFEYKIMP